MSLVETHPVTGPKVLMTAPGDGWVSTVLNRGPGGASCNARHRRNMRGNPAPAEPMSPAVCPSSELHPRRVLAFEHGGQTTVLDAGLNNRSRTTTATHSFPSVQSAQTERPRATSATAHRTDSTSTPRPDGSPVRDRGNAFHA